MLSTAGPYELTTPGYRLSPAPTPYSLFQSVPENIQEHDVFHLSQNVDFGKKLGQPSSSRAQPGGYNEVDTGLRGWRHLLNISN